MPTAMTLEDIKSQQKDYFLARWENGQLSMEPFCYCGKDLEEDYFCPQCQHQCQCTLIACTNMQTVSVVEKFIKGNPDFKHFQAALLVP